MPRMPDFTALGEAASPRPASGVASFSPVDVSGGLARNVIAAGGDMVEASVRVAASNQRQDVMAAEAALNQLQAMRLELEAGEGGFRGVKGGNAVGKQFLDSYQQKFDDIKTRIETGLQNDEQRRVFNAKAPVAGLQYRSALLTHQAQQTDLFNDKTENDSVDLARRQIFQNPTDPIAVQAGMSQIDWAINQKGQRLGWSPEVVQATKEKFRDNIWQDAATILVEQDPAGSFAALSKRLGVGTEVGETGIDAFDKVRPEKAVELLGRARSYVTQAQNKAQAAAEKRLREAEAAQQELLQFSLTGQMVSPGYEQEVLRKVIGTPFEAPARQIITATYNGAMHGSKTLPQQEADLRTLDAQINKTGSSPDLAKAITQMRAITSSQREAYKDNPWAAATRFARQPQVPEVPISDVTQATALIQERLPLVSTIETYAGRAVSPLQPNEASAFADRLAPLPPEAKAQVLGQTGSMLDVPRIAALADQLDKKDKPLSLALKMGAVQTTAGRMASTYVLRGAQALADKTVKKDETALAGWRAEIATLVRGTLGDERAEQDVIDAAYYVRAALDQEGITGTTGLKPMSASAENAIGMVIGYPFERGGVRTFTPRGMKTGEFEDKIGEAAGRLRELGATFYVRGQPIAADALARRIPDAGLRRDGQGRYIPSINNAPVTLDPQGAQPLRLDVR